MGPPRLGPMGQFSAALGSFFGMDSRLGRKYQATLGEVGDWYKDVIATKFAQKHGRSGETEQAIRDAGDFSIPDPDTALYRIAVEAHIGAVIRPLPTHQIPVPEGGALFNAGGGPYSGRMQNFYSAFGPHFSEITWFQGGKESFSPDVSWYREAQPELEAMGQTRLFMLAPFVQQEWQLLAEGETIFSRGQAVLRWEEIQRRAL